MEKESTGLQKDAKTYLDAMRSESATGATQSVKELTAAMSSSQQRIAETIELFYTADKQSEVGAAVQFLMC